MNDNTKITGAFNKAAERLGGMTRNEYIDAILEERPDLKDEMAYVPEQGHNSYTIIIADEVFKFPSFSSIEMECEIEVLKQLEGSSLPVPKITYEGKKTSFFVMTRMKGITLPVDFMETFTEDQKNTLADDILDFVFKMAKICLREEYIEEIENSSEPQFMIHDDFNLGNILIDPVTKKLSAIIDFGNALYGYKRDLKPSFWTGQAQAFDKQAQEGCDEFTDLLSEKYDGRTSELGNYIKKKEQLNLKLKA